MPVRPQLLLLSATGCAARQQGQKHSHVRTSPHHPPYVPHERRYEELLRLNVEAYVQALEAKGDDLSLQEVKAEIKRHTHELEALFEALPQGMAVGLVFVSTTKVGWCPRCRGQ